MDTMTVREIRQNYPLSLLLEADPDIKKIEKYLNKGLCFAAFDDTGALLGVYVLKDQKKKTAEIMNIAVVEKYRRQGIARKMINDAVRRAREDGFEKLLIATGKDSFQQSFYESCGFSIYETDEGYFTRTYPRPVVDNGVVITDLVRLSLSL